MYQNHWITKERIVAIIKTWQFWVLFFMYPIVLLAVAVYGEFPQFEGDTLRIIGAIFLQSIVAYFSVAFLAIFSYSFAMVVFEDEKPNAINHLPHNASDTAFKYQMSKKQSAFKLQQDRYEYEFEQKQRDQERSKLESSQKFEELKETPTINRRKGYVYVVNEINGDHYKIGRSGNPNNRVRTFGVKLPYRIDIDILIPTDDMYALESELHTKFADKRVDGEWFALTPEDIDWIRNEYETEEDKES